MKGRYCMTANVVKLCEEAEFGNMQPHYCFAVDLYFTD
jgi:hypothetical protein